MSFILPTTRIAILRLGVRKALLLLLVIAALAAPSALLAGAAAKGDGTLSIRDGNGRVSLTLTHGIVFGRLESGRIYVDSDDPDAFEDFGTCSTPLPSADETVTRCRGTNIRFRFTANKGNDIIRITLGRGMNITAVGQGTGTIAGSLDTIDTGFWSLNGAPYADLPLLAEKFPLTAAQPAG